MKQKILGTISVLYGLIFINGGMNKFFNYIPVPEDMPEKAQSMFMAMTQIDWLMRLLATFEIIGGLLVIIPRFGALGVLILTPIVIGILLHHMTLGMGLPLALVLAAIMGWMIAENREKYLTLLSK